MGCINTQAFHTDNLQRTIVQTKAGVGCAAFLLSGQNNRKQQKPFVDSKRMTPDMIRLMNKAEEDCGF
jgi:hypothetical protein